MEEKERLTEKSPLNKNTYGVSSKLVCNITENGDWFANEKLFYTGIAIVKLASYENTGLSPEEVEELKKENQELKLKIKSISEKREIENECCSNQVNLWKQEVEALKKENQALKENWNTLCDYLGNELAKDKDCEYGCISDFLDKVNKIKKYNSDLKSASTKLAVEKLEELRARFDYCLTIFFEDTELNAKERNLVEEEFEHAKYIFRDNIDEMLADLKGGNK